jgi:hypothetical protein
VSARDSEAEGLVYLLIGEYSDSIIGVVSPLMLDNLAHGGTYFFFAAFAVLGFLTTCGLASHEMEQQGSR